MNLKVNGESHNHRGEGSIAILLEELGAHPKRTAVMVNDDVVPSARWDAFRLKENDHIELLTLAAGG